MKADKIGRKCYAIIMCVISLSSGIRLIRSVNLNKIISVDLISYETK